MGVTNHLLVEEGLDKKLFILDTKIMTKNPGLARL